MQYSGGSGDADYLENVYYLATYMIAAGGYGNYPLHFINGVFRATQDNSKWSNGYWYWNQRDVYNSFYASNHADLMAAFNRLYSRNYNALKAYTQTRYGIDSLWVPETMGWDGNARGTVNSDYVNDLYSTGTEAAYNMYLYYRYTNDTDLPARRRLPVHARGGAVLPEPAVHATRIAVLHGQLERRTRPTGTCATRSPTSPRCGCCSR